MEMKAFGVECENLSHQHMTQTGLLACVYFEPVQVMKKNGSSSLWKRMHIWEKITGLITLTSYDK